MSNRKAWIKVTRIDFRGGKVVAEAEIECLDAAGEQTTLIDWAKVGFGTPRLLSLEPPLSRDQEHEQRTRETVLKELADAAEAVGYGRHAHPSNIVSVLRDKALGR